MKSTKSNKETIPVQLSNGSIINVEVTYTGNPEEDNELEEEQEYEDEDVSFGMPSFQPVREMIRGVADDIVQTFKDTDIKPSKTAVEFAVELESDKTSLTAKLVPLSGKVNLKILLEWSSEG